MKAFILAAGYAGRLGQMALDMPKPLIEVAGEPLLTHLLRRLLDLDDLSEIVVIGNHRYYVQLQRWADQAESRIKPRVLDDQSMTENDKLGAVKDIGFALEQVPIADEDWLVVAGDNLLAFDLKPLQRTFQKSRRPMLVLRDVDHTGAPTSYNEVPVGPGGRVSRFREKPNHPTTGLSAIALYFFTPKVASYVSQYLALGLEPDAPGHFIAWLVEQLEVGSQRLKGQWFDIGSPETLRVARQNFKR